MTMESFFTSYDVHQELPGQSVLVLAPHPDDEVFGCGATLHQMAQQGHRINIWVVTDGVVAHQWVHADEPQAHRQRLIDQRRSESVAASRCLGYVEPVFLGYEDSTLQSESSLGDDLRRRLDGALPDLILAPSIWEMHRDHRAVARAAISLVSLLPATCRLVFYEVGVPLLPNYLVDISRSVDVKNAAMGCFPSQLACQDYHRQIAGLNQFRSYTLGKSVVAAEAFHMFSRATLEAFPPDLKPDRLCLALLEAQDTVASLKAQLSEYEAVDNQQQGGPLWRRIWRWFYRRMVE